MRVGRTTPLVLVACAACGGGADPDPDPDPIECAPGTMLVGTECVPVAIECDPGTHDEGGTCVPDVPRYELRIAETVLGANGHTRRKVMAFGTAYDGTPRVDEVVLGLDRASAGTYDATALELGPLGATTYFTPCDAASPACLGTATLTLALAGAPADIVASVEIDLVEPTDVSSIAPCLVGGNVLYLDGHDHIRDGMLTVTEASYYVEGTTDEVILHLTPADQIQANDWAVDIDSIDLGTPLVPGIYDADRFHASTPGLAGLSVSGNGSGCNTLTGRLHLYDYTRSGTTVTSVTATFEQHCDGRPELLEGCIHYEAP